MKNKDTTVKGAQDQDLAWLYLDSNSEKITSLSSPPPEPLSPACFPFPVPSTPLPPLPFLDVDLPPPPPSARSWTLKAGLPPATTKFEEKNRTFWARSGIAMTTWSVWKSLKSWVAANVDEDPAAKVQRLTSKWQFDLIWLDWNFLGNFLTFETHQLTNEAPGMARSPLKICRGALVGLGRLVSGYTMKLGLCRIYLVE